MPDFIERSPTLDNYWRSIILFGRNVASYKFALAKALLELRDHGNDLIMLDELAAPFSRHVCEHIRTNPKQATSPSSRFLDACKAHNAGKVSKEELLGVTTRIGFNNVIDAFHVVNQDEIAKRFFLDERRQNNAIRLTDEMYQLFESRQANSLKQEVEARWRLVETSWQLGISRNLLPLQYEKDSGSIVAHTNDQRINVTSSRDALNGYQKGKCFHCFDDISIAQNEAALADVDHFFPHLLKNSLAGFPVDGIWNLVLSCRECNRGRGGKSAKVPSRPLLRRLHTRNEFLISSHHPLRETLRMQTGPTEADRKSFLQSAYNSAIDVLIHTWQPPLRGEEAF